MSINMNTTLDSDGGRVRARLAFQENKVWEVIRDRSYVTACTATDQTLAAASGFSARTTQRILRRLIEQHRVEAHTDAPLRVGNDDEGRYGFKQKRLLYLTSHWDDEAGALYLANLVRRRVRVGRSTRITRDKMCGHLRCTPSQLFRWMDVAEKQGFATFEELEPTVFLCRHTGRFRRVRLPDPNRRLSLCGSFKSNLADALRRLVDSSTTRFPDGTVVACALSNVGIGKLLGISRSSAHALVQKEVHAGRLYEQRSSRKRKLMTVPFLNEEQPDPRSTPLLELLEAGPRLRSDLQRKLGCSSRDLAAALRSARDAGVQVRRFGNERVVFLHELPAEYVELRHSAARARKAFGDAERKWKRRQEERGRRAHRALLDGVQANLARLAKSNGLAPPEATETDICRAYGEVALPNLPEEYAFARAGDLLLQEHIASLNGRNARGSTSPLEQQATATRRTEGTVPEQAHGNQVPASPELPVPQPGAGTPVQSAASASPPVDA